VAEACAESPGKRTRYENVPADLLENVKAYPLVE
jgi:hypothetical protein